MRDTVFLLLALLTLLYTIMIKGSIDMAYSVLFVCEYIVYVIVVLCLDRLYKP